ncbi:UNVERIFIED_ORG: hypothetical protein DFS12_1189 [Chitinophaga ginsengisegetis]|nr:hypothetical protein [Chitinophaga ginsengisegetis]MDR6651104.1 hypothetical protein [Chitinophaga ginsengisegetis]MDR6657454.1 hypothetical protein [Chitinophaga ginsengisegetis]
MLPMTRELMSSLCSTADHIICLPGRKQDSTTADRGTGAGVRAVLFSRCPVSGITLMAISYRPNIRSAAPHRHSPLAAGAGVRAGPRSAAEGHGDARSHSRPRLRPISGRERQRTAKSKMQGQGGRRGADKMDSEGMAGIKATNIKTPP